MLALEVYRHTAHKDISLIRTHFRIILLVPFFFTTFGHGEAIHIRFNAFLCVCDTGETPQVRISQTKKRDVGQKRNTERQTIANAARKTNGETGCKQGKGQNKIRPTSTTNWQTIQGNTARKFEKKRVSVVWGFNRIYIVTYACLALKTHRLYKSF